MFRFLLCPKKVHAKKEGGYYRARMMLHPPTKFHKLRVRPIRLREQMASLRYRSYPPFDACPCIKCMVGSNNDSVRLLRGFVFNATSVAKKKLCFIQKLTLMVRNYADAMNRAVFLQCLSSKSRHWRELNQEKALAGLFLGLFQPFPNPPSLKKARSARKR